MQLQFFDKRKKLIQLDAINLFLRGPMNAGLGLGLGLLLRCRKTANLGLEAGGLDYNTGV